MAETKKGKRLEYRELTAMEVSKLMVEYQFGTPLHILSTKYGIGKRSIKHLASTRSWGEHGGKRDEFIDRATKEVKGEISEAFVDIVKEVNERQLRLYRTATALAVGLMKDMDDRLKLIRRENSRLLAEADAKGTLPRLISTAKEAYTLNQLSDILKKTLIEGERYILGIREGTFDRPDANRGLGDIARVLEEARQEYGSSTE